MAVFDYCKEHPQEMVAAVNSKLQQIAQLYAECEAICQEHGMDFRYDGPAGYGDGGYFYAGEGWTASSNSC